MQAVRAIRRAKRRSFPAIVVLAAGLLAAPPAAAQTTGPGAPADLYDPKGAAKASSADKGLADRRAKAERILALALPKARLAEMLGALRPDLEKQLRDQASRRGKTLTPELAKKLLAAMEQELDQLYSAMLPQLPPIYAATFTDAELDKLLDLYASKEGRSMMAKLNGLSLALADTMRPYVEIYRKRLQNRVSEELKKID